MTYRVSFVATWIALALALAATPSFGQTCRFYGSDLAIVLGADQLGAEPRGALGVSFAAFEHLLLGGRLRWGGFDTGGEAAGGVVGSVGGRFGLLGVAVCPTFDWYEGRFEYEDRFGADRGSVAERSLGLSLELFRPLLRRSWGVLGLSVTPGLRDQRLRIARRTWVIEVPPRLVISENEEDRAWFEIDVDLTLDRGDVGLTLGASSYEHLSRRTLAYRAELHWYLAGRER